MSVIVDVLSFSTSVTVAVERGIRVFPFQWRGASAEAFAARHDAVLSVGRLEAMSGGALAAPSLSPTSLLTCDLMPRLVLPSPNGSTIAAVLQDSGSTVSIGCLRNARAVAQWLAPMIEAQKSVAIIAAGGRWGDDDSLRPALEDQLGAGAILSELLALRYQDVLSPEALTTAETFAAGRSRLGERLAGCVGGRELVSKGFGSDVDIAGELNTSTIVPVIRPEFRSVLSFWSPNRPIGTKLRTNHGGSGADEHVNAAQVSSPMVRDAQTEFGAQPSVREPLRRTESRRIFRI